MTFMTFLLLTALVLTSTAGELLVTHGMKQAGEIDDFRPRGLLRSLWRAVRGGWLVAGAAILILAFLCLLTVLRVADASFVIPATAASYVLNTLGAGLFLKERVGGTRWAGAALVIVGIALVSL